VLLEAHLDALQRLAACTGADHAPLRRGSSGRGTCAGRRAGAIGSMLTRTNYGGSCAGRNATLSLERVARGQVVRRSWRESAEGQTNEAVMPG
jgi:hypothetical protein